MKTELNLIILVPHRSWHSSPKFCWLWEPSNISCFLNFSACHLQWHLNCVVIMDLRNKTPDWICNLSDAFLQFNLSFRQRQMGMLPRTHSLQAAFHSQTLYCKGITVPSFSLQNKWMSLVFILCIQNPLQVNKSILSEVWCEPEM